jgi:sugar/nucleoside kinase (ribokinase family)
VLEFLDAGSIPAVSIYMIYVGGYNLFNQARLSINFERRVFLLSKISHDTFGKYIQIN